MEARTNETTNASGSYVHGVIGLAQDVPEIAALPSLRGVADGEVQALVSTVALAHWTNEALSTEDAVAERARLHQAALEPLLDACTPLPMRLGTILRSDDDVRILLRRTRPLLREAMAATSGRQEWGIKLVVDRAGVADRLQQQDRELQSLARRIEQASEGTRYMLEKRREREAANLVDAESTRLARVARDEIGPSADKRAVLAARDDCALNDSLLVQRAEEAALAQRVAEFNRRLAGSATLHLTGPWPPYSFAPSIQLDEAQADLGR